MPSWVKTSLAPGSLVVTEYLTHSGLMPYLEKLKFNLVGYGCTTCIGNSGPLPQEVSNVVVEKDLVVASVLSGNRNFEGRINSEVRANYLMSPPLVVAYALAGRIDLDMYKEPLGYTKNGKRTPVYLKDIWPTSAEVNEVMRKYVTGDLFQKSYSDLFKGDELWRGLAVPEGETFTWDDRSTYVKNPPYFENMPAHPAPVQDVLRRARALLSRQQRHHGSHLARGLHQAEQSCRAISRGSRCAACGLQLLWLAPRQSRGDDARHVCQRSPAQ